jgi:GNAT superfamily N-acetyltransferase
VDVGGRWLAGDERRSSSREELQAVRVYAVVTRLRITHPDDPAVRPLLDGLADEYARLYGERTDGELSARAAEDFVPPRGAFLLAVSGSTTVAGGGVAPLVGDVAEVKRMWTSPRHRRRGLARRVLGALEQEALALGYRVLRLQTGAMSAPAVALYDTSGYRRIAPFGRYRHEPLAVAFEKRLAA